MYKAYNIKLRRQNYIKVDDSQTSLPASQVPRNTDDAARTDASDKRSEESEEGGSSGMGTVEPGREDSQAALT